MHRIAILDDYQNVAKDMADWDKLGNHVEIVTFADHLADEDEVARRLAAFDIIVMNRERTPFLKSQLAKLPNLKLLLTSGMRNFSIDMAAAKDQGVTVCGTEMLGMPTPELAWGLILGLARQIPAEDRQMKEGGWQTRLGIGLLGRRLGVVGLGRLGVPVAKVGLAFGMDVVAWSPNLTDERAAEHGVWRVDKDELFRQSDFITVHMPLSDRSLGLIAEAELSQMKATAYLVNTSRGPIVDEAALIEALENKRIAGAGIDVYETEPLPSDHPLRKLDNIILTPHMGYVVEENYRLSFGQIVENIEAWIKGAPMREMS